MHLRTPKTKTKSAFSAINLICEQKYHSTRFRVNFVYGRFLIVFYGDFVENNF